MPEEILHEMSAPVKIKVEFFVFALSPDEPQATKKKINAFIEKYARRVLDTHLIQISQLGIFALVFEEKADSSQYSEQIDASKY